jgi:hypothetical protein
VCVCVSKCMWRGKRHKNSCTQGIQRPQTRETQTEGRDERETCVWGERDKLVERDKFTDLYPAHTYTHRYIDI